MDKKGSLIVFSGPSGSGKGTVLSEFFTNYSQNTFLSVSATTRAPRPGEEEGKNYYFKTKEQFEQLISNDGLLEWAQYCGNFYGTPKQAVLNRLDAGQNVILEIETQGAKLVKESFKDAVMVFILPPSLKELRLRLEGRNTEASDVIENRLNAAISEIEFAKQCDYVIINDIVEKAAKELACVISASQHRGELMKEKINNILINK